MNNTTDALTARQTLAYQQGRKAHNVGRSIDGHPYVSGSLTAEAWQNGWRDAQQGIGTSAFRVVA